MIPGPWVALVLALGVYRIVRLVGWDEFPPVARARAWVVGERKVKVGSGNAQMGLTNGAADDEVVFDRPLLEHFLTCPFCVGFWLSVLAYVAWLEEPRWTLYGLGSFALSGAVGLVSKNLDG